MDFLPGAGSLPNKGLQETVETTDPFGESAAQPETGQSDQGDADAAAPHQANAPIKDILLNAPNVI